MEDNVIKLVKVPNWGNYLACEDGRIYSAARKRFIKTWPNKNNGYLQVMLRDKDNYKLYYVHRIIYECFNGEIKGQITHIDGDKTNNAATNLKIRTNFIPSRKMKKATRFFQRYDLNGELVNVYNEETLKEANYKMYSVIAASNNNYVNGGRKTNVYKNSIWKVVRYES